MQSNIVADTSKHILLVAQRLNSAMNTYHRRRDLRLIDHIPKNINRKCIYSEGYHIYAFTFWGNSWTRLLRVLGIFSIHLYNQQSLYQIELYNPNSIQSCPIMTTQNILSRWHHPYKLRIILYEWQSFVNICQETLAYFSIVHP